jgi:hypothetical protein
MDFSEHPSLPTRAPPIATTFRRIVDIPFETCVAAVENWQGAVPHSDLQIGQSLLRGPIEHGRDSGTCRIEVRLARGPLRPLLAMRLNIDRWSGPAARTALELIPGKRIRPTAAYFRAGHLLLDSLTRRIIDLNDLPRDQRQAPAAAR